MTSYSARLWSPRPGACASFCTSFPLGTAFPAARWGSIARVSRGRVSSEPAPLKNFHTETTRAKAGLFQRSGVPPPACPRRPGRSREDETPRSRGRSPGASGRTHGPAPPFKHTALEKRPRKPSIAERHPPKDGDADKSLAGLREEDSARSRGQRRTGRDHGHRGNKRDPRRTL